jgi:hypothetical protein
VEREKSGRVVPKGRGVGWLREFGPKRLRKILKGFLISIIKV